MKFDFVIGNPPYQEDTIGDNKGFAPPVYNKFLDAAYQIADKVEMIHPARFLFNAGSTPKAWNEKMLHDPHFKVLRYEESASTIFPNTDIKGGVAITYRDSKSDFGAIEIFTKYPEVNSVLRKIETQLEYGNLSQIMYNQNKFNLDSMYADYPELRDVIGSDGRDKRFRNNIFDKIPLFSDERKSDQDVRVYGVVKNRRVWKWFPVKYIDLEHENLLKWKVLVARVNGAGVLGETLSSPVVEGPNEGYTQTFIGIGDFSTRNEAENTLKYIKTKFARGLLSVLKITQDNAIETWAKIPLQDFTSSSDIDWSQSIANIDKQLYHKYGLSDEEINFIETNVKEME